MSDPRSPKVPKQKAISLLQQQLGQGDGLAACNTESVLWKNWMAKTKSIIENLFGVDSVQSEKFNSISWYPVAFYSGMSDSEYVKVFSDGLTSTEALLRALISEIENFWPDAPTVEKRVGREEIFLLLSRFDLVVRQLRTRHAERPTLDVENEYDVQDLLHALLRIYFNDVRPEEWCPSYAGAPGRMDFLLPEAEIVIECKMSRPSMTAKTVGEELITDIARYKVHPSVKLLICFVYDPSGRIRNPRGIERDLTKNSDGLDVVCFISPK